METVKDVEMISPEGRSVLKRDGTRQVFDNDKIKERIVNLMQGLNEEHVTYQEVVDRVVSGVYDGKSKLKT